MSDKIYHEGLWRQLVGLDPQDTARRAACRYTDDHRCYIVKLLNTEYAVDVGSRAIVRVSDCSQPQPAGFVEQLCLLSYLLNARDIPRSNRLVKAEQLPSGQFFFRGLHSLPTEKLVNAFGADPELLWRIAPQFQAESRQFGDAAIQLDLLPRVPLTAVVWAGDEQFAPRASILFDATAAEQLPLDALGAAASLAVNALVDAARATT